MLKKIAVDQLRIGMHVHALEGRWIDHPFWKTKFLLEDSKDLKSLRESAVAECWIDVARGRDVDAGPAVEPPRPSPPLAADAAPAAAPSSPPAPPAPSAKTSMRDELEQAAAICKRGRSAVLSMFREARLGQAISTDACRPLIEDIAQSVYRNPGALVSLARLKTKDDYSYMHSVAVGALMIALGRQLGLDEAACRDAGLAGLLHDLGKALMPLEILNKPGKLSDEEFAIIRTHPERGHELLQEGQGAPESAMDVCLRHHERIDGTGYPGRLPGTQLSLLARMGAVCDVYDAITSNRPYKAGWDPAESIARMGSWKGHFDPAIFAAFVKSLGIYPTGSLVRLESGKLAVVIEQNAEKLAAPVVKAFYSTKSSMPIAPLVIDLARPGCAERIAAREPADKFDKAMLDALWLPPEVQARSK